MTPAATKTPATKLTHRKAPSLSTHRTAPSLSTAEAKKRDGKFRGPGSWRPPPEPPTHSMPSDGVLETLGMAPPTVAEEEKETEKDGGARPSAGVLTSANQIPSSPTPSSGKAKGAKTLVVTPSYGALTPVGAP